MKMESASAPCSNPEIMVRIFRHVPHTTVTQAIFLVVKLKALSIKVSQTAAIKPCPNSSVVCCQNGHGYFVRKSVGGGKHSDRAFFEAKEPVSIRAHP